MTSVNAHFPNANDQQNELQVSQAFIQKMTTALSDEWPNSDGRYVSSFPYITSFLNTIKKFTLNIRNVRKLKCSHIFIKKFIHIYL